MKKLMFFIKLLVLAAALSLFSLTVWAQTITVSGTVKDSKGTPIPGARIQAKETPKLGAISDIDGKYSIQNIPSEQTLMVSYMGMKTIEVALNGRRTVDFTLVEDTEVLDELVVVGYGVQKKRDLTGAISSVNMKETPVNTYSTISHALAGKAAGLRVTQYSAQVGGAANFRIRGAASTGAGNDPLIIIDGFPVGGGGSLGSGNRYNAGSTDNILASINPNDIESVEVLKDASSTAIYGSRAGHGVIIFTTKRGKAQKVQVSYSGNIAFQHVRRGYKTLSGPEYMRQFNRYNYEEFLRKHGKDVYKDYITPADEIKDETYTPTFSDEDIANAANTDWFGAVTRNGLMQTHNLSVNGGTKDTKYMVSLNMLNHKGIIKQNNLSRFTTKINLDQKIGQLFKTGISLNLSRNTLDNVALGEGQFEFAGVISAAAMFNPTLPIYDEKGNYSVNPYFSQLPNPVSLLEIEDRTGKDRLLGSAYLEMKPLESLTLKASFGLDRRYEKRKNYLPRTTMYGQQVNGQAAISSSDGNDYLMELTATYNKSFGQHDLTALMGYSFQQFNSEWFSAGNQDFLLDGFKYNNLGAGNFVKPSVGSGAWRSSLGSYFGRLNYSYLGRYLMTATLRADGASNFSPEHRWGYFPSLSLGWRFSDESFMQQFTVLSNGKLRLSYGQTGNSNVGNRTQDLFNTGFNNVFGDKAYTGVVASQLGNPTLTWETTSEFNVGLDLGFFKNRVSLTMEYFNRTISDLLVKKKPLPSYNEVSHIAANIGSTQSRGFEFTLNTVNITGGNFEWSTDATLSFYRDRWKDRDPNWKPEPYESRTDYIRSAFSYKSDGLLKAGEKAPKHQPALLPGQVKLVDQNNDGVLDNKDIVLLGSWDPAFIFGLNNTLRYKGFDFNIYLYGEVNRLRGPSYYESWSNMGYGLVQGRNSSQGYAETWSHDNQNASLPNILGSGDKSGVGDFYLQKISFIRCRNITLGYTLPSIPRLAKSIRLYADINNPFVITNYSGLDPETDSHQYSYPNVTSLSFGVDINF